MAYGARLESVLGASPRGFESPILRAPKARDLFVRSRAFVVPRMLCGARRRLVVVATFSSVSRQNVLQAISEYDSRGGTGFLER